MKMIEMIEIIAEMLGKYGTFLIAVIYFVWFGIRIILFDTLDKVFMSKEKQVITSLIKGSFLIIILGSVYFMTTFCLSNSTLVFMWDILEKFWGLIWLAIILFVLIAIVEKLRKFIRKEKIFQIFKIIWFIYYLYSIIFGIAIENIYITYRKNINMTERMVSSILVAIWILGMISVSLEALNKLSASKSVVWFVSEDFGKLYLVRAFDKNNILCRGEYKNKHTKYVLVPKKDFLKKKIFVGEEILDKSIDSNEDVIQKENTINNIKLKDIVRKFFKK